MTLNLEFAQNDVLAACNLIALLVYFDNAYLPPPGVAIAAARLAGGEPGGDALPPVPGSACVSSDARGRTPCADCGNPCGFVELASTNSAGSMIMNHSFSVLAMTAALTTSGCAVLTAAPPTVDVLDARLTAIGLTEQQLAVILCVTNPNPSELSFSRVTTALDVAGSPLAEGVSNVPVHLPPLSSTAVPFTVVTTVRNLGPQLAAIFRSGQIDYRLHGSVSLEGGLALTIPYSRSGRLDPLASGLDMSLSAAQAPPSRCAAPA